MCSGDILQFGVDVMENSRKVLILLTWYQTCTKQIVMIVLHLCTFVKPWQYQVTHGCIIATLKLYLPDGKEAKVNEAIKYVAKLFGQIIIC